MRRAALAATAVLASGGAMSLALGVGVAAAAPAPPPRLVSGNVANCAQAGLAGSVILEGVGDASNAAGSGDVSDDGLFLDVTINAGFTATGVAVKGGPNTNVYDGPFVGPTSIEGMRAPNNEGGQQPTISHWLVCGQPTVPTGAPRTGGGGSQGLNMLGAGALAVAAGGAVTLLVLRRRRALG